MKSKVVLVLLVLLTAFPIATAFSDDNVNCSFCFRSKPKPKCCSFLIFESGLLFRLAGNGQPTDKEEFLINGSLGFMLNLSDTKAAGGFFHIAGDDHGMRWGFGPRLRIWSTTGTALDLSSYILIPIHGENEQVIQEFPGFGVGLSYSVFEFFSVDARFESIKYEETVTEYPLPPRQVKDTDNALYLGASGRSYAGGFMGLVVLGFILILQSSDGGSFW